MKQKTPEYEKSEGQIAMEKGSSQERNCETNSRHN